MRNIIYNYNFNCFFIKMHINLNLYEFMYTNHDIITITETTDERYPLCHPRAPGRLIGRDLSKSINLRATVFFQLSVEIFADGVSEILTDY